ncbi:ParA family protein [Phenylobacterium sp.]|uniref:ParA family protein n=1 Tax=Phenylobacterium sp. TaxID=1871053 RepID=UPI0027337442|nr:ParA family protein [Phenylobacterium sp.]MDP3175950.1 ParA family protein [Phenylobacterium sp.]MDP3658684.1 ParA family protein [Phenylobacterium sp.]
MAVIALKGGSGKTTVATHLALAAYRRGLAVLVVDIDPQHSALDALGARETPGPDVVASTGPKLVSAQFAASGLAKDLLIIDTPAGAVEDVGEALVLADLAVMVVRPTLLDIAGLVRTFTMVRKLGKPAVVVVNQAPVAREAVEAPLVKRALRGLEYMQAPLAPVILRARAVYQTALERGRSAEETPDRAAAAEIAALWDYIAAKAQITKAQPQEA